MTIVGERHGHVHRRRHAVDVRKRDHGEERLASLAQRRNPVPGLQGVRDEVAVGEHHTFGLRGGSRCELNQREVVGRGLELRRVRAEFVHLGGEQVHARPV
jgi:hypothetical protein